MRGDFVPSEGCLAAQDGQELSRHCPCWDLAGWVGVDRGGARIGEGPHCGQGPPAPENQLFVVSPGLQTCGESWQGPFLWSTCIFFFFFSWLRHHVGS